MLKLLIEAGRVAMPSDRRKDPRGFWLGCVGVRTDGAIVASQNGAVMYGPGFRKITTSHAEGRCMRKMNGGRIYVARISRQTGEFVMARPCEMCQILIKAKKIEKVFYTVNQNQYGIWDPELETDRIFNC